MNNTKPDSNGNVALNFDTVKSYQGVQTLTAKGDTDDNVWLADMPSSFKNILAVIPYGYSVSANWDTRLIFKGISQANLLSYRTQGSTNQTYTIRYFVLYI